MMEKPEIRNPKSEIVIIGIGNSGRQDDGLGWAFLDRIEPALRKNAAVEYRYQLQVEDAELIAQFARVIFVDADTAPHEKGFAFTRVEPDAMQSYTSHRLAPETVLDLAQKLYGKFPECFLLGISGHSFELKIGLTSEGEKNLQRAVEFFRSKLT